MAKSYRDFCGIRRKNKEHKIKIGLIDVDGRNFPNLALMKLSAWHKAQGDTVEWYSPFEGWYDVVYKSKVFSFSEDDKRYINAYKVVEGGSGYAISLKNGKECYGKDDPLPYQIEHIYPDYGLYPKYTQDTAYGFLTRGCPMGCSFCHVAAKEGRRSVKVADLSEFWRGQRNIVICDPNILACKDWKELLQQLIMSGAYIDFNQGLDARLMTKEKAEMLGRIRIKEVHFAWDRYEDGPRVIKGLELYSRYAKRRPHGHSSVVYTLTNFDTTIEQDLERIYTLRNMGFWAYVMIYNKEEASETHKKMARWCNNRYIFGKVRYFQDYEKEDKSEEDTRQLSLF